MSTTTAHPRLRKGRPVANMGGYEHHNAGMSVTIFIPPACAVPLCPDPAKARGWCSKHYRRWQKHGDVGDPAGNDHHRYPFEPLAQAAAAGRPAHIPIDCRYCDQSRRSANCYQIQNLADDLRVNKDSIYKWRRRGLSARTADVLACRLGLTPDMIWPEWTRWSDQSEAA